MSKRLNNIIKQKCIQNKKLLSVFITAGFPEKSDTVEIILSLADTGVDFIELGLPFSDPIADGPIIQASSQKALDNEVTIEDLFKYVETVRKKSPIPIILMGYLNPLHSYGIRKAIKVSHQAGIDGWIIPDWPLEESKDYLPLLEKNDLDLIHLIAPNTATARIKEIDQISTSFIYCVAYTGVTGKDNRPTRKTIAFFENIQKFLQHPLMIGFGIKSQQDFITYTSYSDGVIIGSAFIKMIQETPRDQFESQINKFIRDVKGSE